MNPCKMVDVNYSCLICKVCGSDFGYSMEAKPSLFVFLVIWESQRKSFAVAKVKKNSFNSDAMKINLKYLSPDWCLHIILVFLGEILCMIKSNICIIVMICQGFL